MTGWSHTKYPGSLSHSMEAATIESHQPELYFGGERSEPLPEEAVGISGPICYYSKA